MRSYTPDSPEAMARILALSMLADGGLDQSELEVVVTTKILDRIGMSPVNFDIVVKALCEDMLQSMRGYDYGKIELDRKAIDHLLAEIKSPQLQRLLLSVMLAVVDADDQLSDGEAVLIAQAMEVWQLDLHEVAHVRTSATDARRQKQSQAA